MHVGGVGLNIPNVISSCVRYGENASNVCLNEGRGRN